MENKRAFAVEEKIIVNDEERFFLAHKSPLIDKYGKIIGIVGISIDITDRKRAEQLEIEKRMMAEKVIPFISKDETRKGTGLGLAYCKMIMRDYGGDITCESKLGEYTKFICTFPAVNMDEL